MNKKQLTKLFQECATKHGVKSGNACYHLFDNHSHPLGDDGEDMVTVKVALEALRIAEKELINGGLK